MPAESVAEVLAGGRRWGVRVGDCLESLRAMPDGCVRTCVTSPPYFGLRDYGCAGQIGLEPTPDEFIAKLVAVFREVRRVLADDGTLWLNLGDSYNAYNGNRGRSKSFQAATDLACPSLPGGHGLTAKGLKNKDLIGIPWSVAFALRADGWYLRQELIWAKPNGLPESVTDRCTKSHEHVFLLSKSPRYYFDADAIAEPVSSATRSRLSQPTLATQVGSFKVPGKSNGPMKAVGNTEQRNARSVWSINVRGFRSSSGHHYATMPPELARRCVLAGSAAGDIVLDPFAGSGTTLAVAVGAGRRGVGIELNPKYAELIRRRMAGVTSDLFTEATP